MFLLWGMAVCSKIRVYLKGFNMLKFVAATAPLAEEVRKFQRLLVFSLQQYHPLIHPALLWLGTVFQSGKYCGHSLLSFNSWQKFLLLLVVLPLKYICYINPFRQKRRNKNRIKILKRKQTSQSILPGESSRYFLSSIIFPTSGCWPLSSTVVTQIEKQLIFFHLYSSVKRHADD